MWTLLLAAGTGVAGYLFGRSSAGPSEAEHQALITALGLLNRRGRSELLSIAKEPSRSVPVPGRPDLMQVTARVPYFTSEERRIILADIRVWQQAEVQRTGRPLSAPAEMITDEEIQGIPAVQQTIRPGMEGRFRLIQRWI